MNKDFFDRQELALLTSEVLDVVKLQTQRAEVIAKMEPGGKESARTLMSECGKILKLCNKVAEIHFPDKGFN